MPQKCHRYNALIMSDIKILLFLVALFHFVLVYKAAKKKKIKIAGKNRNKSGTD